MKGTTSRKPTGQRVGYVRVSSAEQNPARQYEALGECDRTFEDRASGKSTDRPALGECLSYVRDGDTLVVASLDRAARNLADLLDLVAGLTERGIAFVSVKENLTLTGQDDDAMSRLLLSLLGAVAEFERSLIRERQREGIAAAKARGEYLGRGGRPCALSDEQAIAAAQRVAAGEAKRHVARDLGVGRTTLYRALARVAA